jgi:hypothetical protein
VPALQRSAEKRARSVNAVLCPEHKVEMRPVRNERGQMIDTCYRCEREKKQEDDSTVIEKLRKRDREQE